MANCRGCRPLTPDSTTGGSATFMFEAATLGLTCGGFAAAAVGLAGGRQLLDLRRRRRTAHRHALSQRREFARQLAAAVGWARASQPHLKAWTGLRDFCVVRVVDESADCRSYYLEPVDGRPLPRYAPGQYLTVRLPATLGEPPIVRCYTLSDRPREAYYRLTVKRVAPPDDAPTLPPGRASNYFHSRVAEGTILQAEAPQGAFFLDPADRLPVVLIGGGIGVTPLAAMAASLTQMLDPRPVAMFLGYRNSREAPLQQEFVSHCRRNGQLQLDVSYSRPLPDDLLGRDFDHRGHVDLDRLRAVLPASNYRFFLCGPPAMIASLSRDLTSWGVPAEHIHTEAFGPASIAPGNVPAGRPCDVQLSRSARTLRYSGSEPTLLALIEAAGVPIESGCRAGNCGQCAVRLAAGAVNYLRQPGVELVEGDCLTCIATPQGDLVLDL